MPNVLDWIKLMPNYIKSRQKTLEEPTLPAETFTCDQCGKCCNEKHFDIGINLLYTDVREWMDSEAGVLLSSMGVQVFRSTGASAVFLDRKEDYLNKLRFKSDAYKKVMVEINPSLALVNDAEKLDCVFFNCLDNKCSIYDERPISCRVFPYQYKEGDRNEKGVKTSKASIVVDHKCPEGCFKKGPPKDSQQIKDNLVKLMACFKAEDLFFKAKLHGIDSQRNNMYLNLVVGMYLAFPTWSNIELLKKSIAEDNKKVMEAQKNASGKTGGKSNKIHE